MIFFELLSPLVNGLDIFGRAGGGGSSSGSSGGGGDFLIAVVGYAPMHVLGNFLAKKLAINSASLIGWPIAIIYAAFWIFIMPNLYGVLIAGGALVGIGAGLYKWFDKIAKLSKKAKLDQTRAVQNDAAWDITSLNSYTGEIFAKYQFDWSNNNIEPMKAYLTPYYAQHNYLMMLALDQLQRQNLVGSPIIDELNLVRVQDEGDDSKDSFVMHIKAHAVDDLIESKTGKLLFRDNRQFAEYWRFIRNGQNSWLLDGIEQETVTPSVLNASIMQFALAKNYFFSPDWGWLLLPSRGQLFNGGKFGTSDINNHVIGVYNNILIQLYNYISNPKNTNSVKDNYIIAQVALPKTYGNIVVRRKHLLSFNNNKGLTKVSMEWGEFNKTYEVWASDMERVTSFELLNPSFMVKLQELPFEVNIEVVDNIVYLYGNKIQPSQQSYETMLAILQQAFKEMRM